MRAGRSYTHYHHGENHHDLLLVRIRVGLWQISPNLKKNFLWIPTPALPWLTCISYFLSLLLLGLQWYRVWCLWSIHHTLSLMFIPPHTLLLLQCGASPTGDSLPWTFSILVIPTCQQFSASFSIVGPWRQRLLQPVASQVLPANRPHLGSTTSAKTLFHHRLPVGHSLLWASNCYVGSSLGNKISRLKNHKAE